MQDRSFSMARFACPPFLNKRQRDVAGRKLVVTANAIIRGMAGRAGLAIDGRILAMNIVPPARRMRHRRHDQMTRERIAALALADGRLFW